MTPEMGVLMHGHDIIVLGGSAGSLEGLRRILPRLPSDLPASLFIAIHHPPYAPSNLPEILSRVGPLPARHAVDREAFRPGIIYIAPPDHHLLVVEGHVRVVQGPKENNSRPAIDPLFRSAAVAYGPRVVGVVLSGYLDDGASGLAAIRLRGGVAAVQDPDDALFRDMPENALQSVPDARRLPAGEIAAELLHLVREPAPPPAQPVPPEMAWEVAVAAWDLDALSSPDRPGKPSPFSCPDCGGDLWERTSDGRLTFRCRTGHAYSPLSLLAVQARAADDTLNQAFRALKEKEHMERRMARMAGRGKSPKGVTYHEAQAVKAAQAAESILRLLLDMKPAESGAEKMAGG